MLGAAAFESYQRVSYCKTINRNNQKTCMNLTKCIYIYRYDRKYVCFVVLLKEAMEIFISSKMQCPYLSTKSPGPQVDELLVPPVKLPVFFQPLRIPLGFNFNMETFVGDFISTYSLRHSN